MADAGARRELPVVLLIDDDMVSREVTATVLIMGSYIVHTAENGEAGLRLLESGGCAPGVILVDTQMPGLSGAELIAALRALVDTKLFEARLFAVSGSRPSDEVLAAADGFLLKPFDCDALGRLLEGWPMAEASSLRAEDEQVVSAQVLAELRQMMPEKSVRQIYEAMVRDLAVRIEALGVAVGRGDLAEVRRIGHAIKGGCGMAGAMQAARLGARLETVSLEDRDNGPDNGSDNSAVLLGKLRVALKGLESMLSSDLPV